MADYKQFSQTYYEKANEEVAFRDYAAFRYGTVAQDPAAVSRINDLRKNLDPILVDIVDGGIEAAIMEAEAAVERTARSTISENSTTTEHRSIPSTACRSRACPGPQPLIRFDEVSG